VLRFVFRCKLWPFFDVNYTVSYDHNTVPAKRAIYGTFTAVSLPFLNVYVNENGGIRSFTIVVSIDLGDECSAYAKLDKAMPHIPDDPVFNMDSPYANLDW
jgi:hypothetical protein